VVILLSITVDERSPSLLLTVTDTDAAEDTERPIFSPQNSGTNPQHIHNNLWNRRKEKA